MKLKFGLTAFLIILLAGCAVNPRIIQDVPIEPPVTATIVNKPMIALTYDDGPSEFTRPILDILERHGARATFFVLGESVHKWPNTLQYAVKNGNEIASHTWSHYPLTALSKEEIIKNIRDTNAIIENVSGVRPQRYYRPPYGLVDRRIADISAEIGYSMAGWTVDPQEWKHYNPNLIYEHVMDYVKENSIILLHDIFHASIPATERLVPALIAKGYQLVTLSELLQHVYGELKPGIMYGNPGIVRQ